ncbi:anti-sigma factor [Bacteroidales bacterium]|nr:anti-sigma factor [Bacteroidales bacterium]
MPNKYIHKLMLRFFENDFSEDLRLKFQQWFTSGLDQEQKAQAMEEIWENSIVALSDAQTFDELQKIHQRMAIQSTSKLYKDKIVWRSRLLRIAGILILPLLGAFSTYLIFEGNSQIIETELVECFVPRGQRKQIILSDGSEVWLNAGSILIYEKQFNGKTRNLFLNGEAYFKVAKDDKKPFIVKTQYMNVEVLGTCFNVESFSDSDLSIATLEEGKVQIEIPILGGEKEILSPNDQLVYNHVSGELTKKNIANNKTSEWRQGYLIFQSASFDQIIKTIERRFKVIINYENDKYAGRSFTMKFDPDEDLTEVLNILRAMIPELKYTIRNNTVNLK